MILEFGCNIPTRVIILLSQRMIMVYFIVIGFNLGGRRVKWAMTGPESRTYLVIIKLRDDSLAFDLKIRHQLNLATIKWLIVPAGKRHCWGSLFLCDFFRRWAHTIYCFHLLGSTASAKVKLGILLFNLGCCNIFRYNHLELMWKHSLLFGRLDFPSRYDILTASLIFGETDFFARCLKRWRGPA